MMRKYFSLLLMLLASFPAWAGSETIPPSECQSFDYSSRFGPVRDQDGHGLCWAFAAGALLEEDLCLSHREICGKVSLSTLDIARSHFQLTEKTEGWDQESAIRYIMNPPSGDKPGVCAEQYAPFYNVKGFKCSVLDFLGRGPSCLHGKLASLYRSWEQARVEQCTRSSGAPSHLEILTRELRDLLPKHEALGVDFENALASSPAHDKLKFLERILITPECKKNRYQFKSRNPLGVSVYLEDDIDTSPKRPVREKLKSIVEGFRSGRSSTLSLCANRLTSSMKNGSGCRFHGVVATGLRWNAKKNRCEIQLRNSWGEGADLNGWLDANKVIKWTDNIFYLK